MERCHSFMAGICKHVHNLNLRDLFDKLTDFFMVSVKAHVGRWSEDCPEHQGVVIMNMHDLPLVCCMPTGSVQFH